jgi:xylan 1,4-beta-xylosidase
MTRALLVWLATGAALSAQPVRIEVDAAQKVGAFKPIYRFFGYDEPNYTYAPNGRKLVGELARVSESTTYLRTHFLLTTGNGAPDLKWGSTNAYREDASGKPIYDWTITDRIFDTYLEMGAKPFVEIGFMPEALSTKPQPYRPVWSPGAAFDKYYVGWAYPPKDFSKWGELVYQWARHTVEKYGLAEVESWYWEVWNEPDIAYWRGTPEEYDQLYDAAVKAVKRAAPRARVGGPATTGPASAKASAFLRQFLEHCDKRGAPLDFVSFHAKGRPTVVEGHVRMGIDKNIEDVTAGFRVVASFPKFRALPIVLSESDPEGCAACSARVYPQNAYRNGPLYPSYTASMLKRIFEAADREKVNIEGMLTWAFEFEGQPYFDGFRTLATNGIDKPILNVFRMAGLMRGDRVKTDNAGSANVDVLAARSDRQVAMLVWNYDRDDVPGPDAEVRLAVAGLPEGARRVLVEHYRIDGRHSNAYAVWKRLGSPQQPSAEQYAELQSAGQLQTLESPRWMAARSGRAEVSFALPRQGVSLVRIVWP